MLTDDTWNFLTKISAGIGSSGVVLLLILLYAVNKERVEKDKMLMQVTVSGIKAMNAATKAIDSLRGEVKAIRRRAGGR
jgi:hypothetical protein